jgi:hypothetical protein
MKFLAKLYDATGERRYLAGAGGCSTSSIG